MDAAMAAEHRILKSLIGTREGWIIRARFDRFVAASFEEGE